MGCSVEWTDRVMNRNRGLSGDQELLTVRSANDACWEIYLTRRVRSAAGWHWWLVHQCGTANKASMSSRRRRHKGEDELSVCGE
jgi:hypothetical protein